MPAGVRAKNYLLSKVKSKIAERVIGIASSGLRTVAERMRGRERERIAQVADTAAEGIAAFSRYLEEKDVEKIVNEAEDFARRHPAFLIGTAFAAGFFLVLYLQNLNYPEKHFTTDEHG